MLLRIVRPDATIPTSNQALVGPWSNWFSMAKIKIIQAIHSDRLKSCSNDVMWNPNLQRMKPNETYNVVTEWPFTCTMLCSQWLIWDQGMNDG